MATLSICLIIKNEGNCLERCLSSIKAIADEIIVVDTGSSDESVRIASDFDAKVFLYKWGNNFSSVRNYSLDKASGDWILVLDGDEELEGLGLELLKQKIQNSEIEACLLTVTHSLKNQKENPALSFLQLRLFRNNNNYHYRGFIHENILDSILEHNPSAVIEIVPNITIIHHGRTKEDATNQARMKRNAELIKTVLEEEETVQFIFLGREHYHNCKYLEALGYFQLAYDKSDCPSLYISELCRSIITCLYMLGRTSEALTFLENVLSMRTDSADLYYLRGIIYKDQNLYAQAYKSFKEALSYFPLFPCRDIIYYHFKYFILYLLGSLAEYFMDRESALFYYYESLKNNSCFVEPLRKMIIILKPRKNPAYTVDSLQRIFDLSDKSLQSKIATIFYNEGAYKLALDCINQLDNYGQISEKTRLLKGLSLMRLKKYKESEKVFQSITQNKNLFIEARQYLLFYYWLVKDYCTASSYLRQIKNASASSSTIYVLNLLTCSSADKIAIVQEQTYELAKELMDLLVELGDSGQITEAFYNFAPILGKRPSYLLAELYYNYEKYELAKREFLFLLEKGNDYPCVYYYLGRTCWTLGNMEEARQNILQAINKGLDTPRIRREMARLYQELAIKTLKEGMSSFSEKLEMKQIQELEKNLLEI